jgi:hypothetical protein
MSGALLARDDSRMLSGLHQCLVLGIFLGINLIFIGSGWPQRTQAKRGVSAGRRWRSAAPSC